MTKPKVSIIIPTLNEEKNIGNCLSAIFKQSYDDYEVIVADNGSKDKTISIAHLFTKNVFQDETLNISGLRNLGASKAIGDVFAFLDSDCIPDESWLSNAITRLNNDNVGVTGCHCQIPANSTWVEKAWYLSKPKGIGKVNFIGTANFFVWRDLFNQLEGFRDEIKTGEDYEFCQRVIRHGYEVLSDDTIRVVHLRGPNTLKEKLKKEIWYGLETRTILKFNKFYYPFIASLIFMFLFILILLSLFSWNPFFVFLSIFSFFFFLSTVSFRRCYKANNFSCFLKLIPIYFAYLSGRTISLLYFFRKRKGLR